MDEMLPEQEEKYKIALATVKTLQRRFEKEPKTSRMKIYDEIANDFGISPNTLRLRYACWEKYGDLSLIPKIKGRKKGDGKYLSDDQEAEIQKLIIDKTPDQMKMPFALWTRKAVQELIYSRYGIDLVITAVGKYLKKWGFTAQVPTIKKPGQRPVQVEQWLKQEYPAIQAQAQKENAEIWWGDETGVQNQPHQLRGYSPCGVTPSLTGPRKRLHLHMISAVSNQGAVRFRVHPDSINVDRFKDFLERMIKDTKGKKIILIVDNLRVHHAKILQPWLLENKDKIELKFLPSYSPEMNPDEYLNRDLKSRLSNQPTTSNGNILEDRVMKYMDMLGKDQSLVCSFFAGPQVRYAA